MHGLITARIMCISYWYRFILITLNGRFRIKPEPVQTVPHWYVSDLPRLRHISSMVLWLVFGPWRRQSWGFGTIYVLQGRVVSPTPNWTASSSHFSPPTCLIRDAIPGTMLLPVQLGGSLKHTIPTTTCKGPTTRR
jgi:hypothetical protein